MSKILVVDDEVGIREVVRDALNKDGHEVTTVPSADQAYATLLKQPFDLVITDLQIADASGMDVLKKIRELQKDVPVIILTNLETAENVDRALELGATTYLVKANYELEEVLKKIRETLNSD